MRGNHRVWGRQDYVEPSALSPGSFSRVRTCLVKPRDPNRANPWNSHEVYSDGILIGYVTTRLSGQQYRTKNMDYWLFAANDWNQDDPPHAHAILKLLDYSNG